MARARASWMLYSVPSGVRRRERSKRSFSGRRGFGAVVILVDAEGSRDDEAVEALGREEPVVVVGKERADGKEKEGRSWNSLYRFLSLSSGRAFFLIPRW